MHKSTAWLGLMALAVVVAIHGCGDESQTPVEPAPDLGRTLALGVPTCGEVTYLGELSPVLAVWQDSLGAWQPDTTLVDAPEWTDGPVAEYLAGLVPALQQWQGALNTVLGTDLLAAVDDFDPGATTTQAYLAYLTGLLAGWEAAAEGERGTDFLPTPPTFAPDEFAPVLECLADTTITCADSAGVVVEFDVVAMDDCDEAPVVVCDPASGSTFPVGTTTVTCTATDASGNESTCSFDVTVETAAVVIHGASASPATLWPPNHTMVDIAFTLDAENPCGLELECTVLEVTSNEPIDGLGDGDTEPDWMIGDDGSLKLRAERSGTGSSRIYTIRLRCEDPDSGVGDETTVEVVVPHDRGGH